MTKKTIAHFTDAHIGQMLVSGSEIVGEKMSYANVPDQHWDRIRVVLDDIERKGISDVIFGGDIGAPGSTQGFFDLLKDYGFGFSIVLGNHDAYDAVAPYCLGQTSTVEGKLCSSDIGTRPKIIILDSSDNRLGEDQLAWLTGALEDSREVALFLHHPILAIDTPIEHSGAALRNREKVKRLLMAANCEISLFCGHYHMIDEAVEGRIHQFVTPAVSYQIIKNADRVRSDVTTFGYRRIELGGDHVKTDVVLFEASS